MASEYLGKREGIAVSKESRRGDRQWLIEAGVLELPG
jgi:hypothetical protein